MSTKASLIGAKAGDIMSKPFDVEMALIGHLNTEWNDIEHTWYVMYSLLMHQTPKNVRDAIFKLSNTGSAQRKLVMTVANQMLDGSPELVALRKELGKACDSTDTVSKSRNAVVHGQYRLTNGSLMIIVGDEMGKPNKLANKPLKPELERVQREMEILRVNAIDGIWGKLNARFPTT
jgi:hypothetical protein